MNIASAVMNLDWQTIATSSGIAFVIVAIVNGGFARPKTKAEAKDHDSAAFDRLTDAQIARQIDALASAERATKSAEAACNACEKKLHVFELKDNQRDRELDIVLSALVEIVPLLPAEGEAVEPLRSVIRTLRRIRYDGEE